VMAASGTALRYRNIRRLTSSPPAVLEEKANKAWLYLVGPGWLARTALTGVLITLGVGIPIGLLIAFGSDPSELPSQSRVLMVLAFTGMTGAWAIPISFLLRWVSIRSQRKLMYDPASRDTATQ